MHHKFSESRYIFLILFVDNILITVNDKEILCETKKFLLKNLEIKDLGEASFALRIQIHHNCSWSILRLSQKIYIEKVLKNMICKIVNQKIPLSLRKINSDSINALK